MCSFALVPALSYTTHVPLYSDCTDVFTILHLCLFQSNCVENISTGNKSTATRGCPELVYIEHWINLIDVRIAISCSLQK